LKPDKVSPSIASLERIASILGITLAGFFTGQKLDASIITHADKRQKMTSSWSRARIEALMSSDTARRLEAVMITIAPGGRSGKQPSSHLGEEFALVFEGEVFESGSRSPFSSER
jgi:transcriptional regulator with XRE-family HTH domain